MTIQRLVQPRPFVNRLGPKAALALLEEAGGQIIGVTPFIRGFVVVSTETVNFGLDLPIFV